MGVDVMTRPEGSRHRIRLGDRVYEWDEAEPVTVRTAAARGRRCP